MASAEAGIGCMTGIAPWKRRRVAAMLGRPPHRASAASAIRLAKRRGGAVACWATRMPPGLEALARQGGVALWRIEDGFIRSAGLGAALVQPCSIVLDRTGMHYDPSQPSDLETLLNDQVLSGEQIARAERLIAQLRDSGITKYNLQGDAVQKPPGRPTALVVGQVDSDQSLRLGGSGLVSADLLRRVREEDPAAFVIYRPHPDVVAGLRDGLHNGLADAWADRLEPAAAITRLLDIAHTVHVITSLAGFEALLRDRRVVTHGAPFYAGWGLTEDRLVFPRRTRRLSLPELVYGALIAYPRYAHPRTGRPCEVEHLVEVLSQDGIGRAGPGMGQRLLARAALAMAKWQGRGRW